MTQFKAKHSGTWKDIQEAYYKEGGVWTLFYEGVQAHVYTETISTTVYDYNLYNQLVADGWDETSPVDATITIGAAGKVGATSTATPAFAIGTFPLESTITLQLDGKIQGMGGAGGNSWHQTPSEGSPGGDALSVAYAINLNGDGDIWGGGGGGASSNFNNGYREDGGGGGGAGLNVGSGGLGWPFTNGNGWGGANAGADGTETTGGAGGAAANDAGPKNTVAGGDGGDPGQAGEDNTTRGYSGGAAGSAIDGISYVTINGTPDIQGPQV